LSNKEFINECQWCHKEFTSKQKRTQYCSSICYGRAARKKSSAKIEPYSKNCEFCEKDFVAKQERTRFCSSLCGTKFRYQNENGLSQNRQSQERKCKSCGETFVANRVDKMFCSQDCQWHYRYEKKRKVYKKIKCKKCGKEFLRKVGSQKYCSRECRFRTMSKTSYDKRKWFPKSIRRPDGSYVSEHRYIIEQHVGRELKPHEQVHHIDIDSENNNIENLHLFTTRKSHGNCHASINNLIKGLMKMGIVGFNKEEGVYFLKEQKCQKN